jgi:FkbM family methyltransferase
MAARIRPFGLNLAFLDVAVRVARVARKFAGNLGIGGLAKYVMRAPLRRFASGPYRLSSPYARYSVWVRPRTSDIYVFDQIFAKREYRCLDGIPEPLLIIDCGANVGYSAAYFLSRYPRARLMAIEPDSANFEALTRNTENYGSRVCRLNCAVWSHATRLVLSEGTLGDYEEWGRTVREAKVGETATIEAVEIGSLIEPGTLVKMDVEGAEEVLFASPPSWLSRVSAIVIEVHSRHGERLVSSALRSAGFALSQCEELLVGIKI